MRESQERRKAGRGKERKESKRKGKERENKRESSYLLSQK